MQELCNRAEQRLRHHEHGDLPRWREALHALPVTAPRMEANLPAPRLGQSVEDPQALAANLMQLHPWRKGPLCLGGCEIDTEWRSDWKWNRLAPHVDWRGARVLDIGCGNGYFGWRMLGAGASLVVGIDPTLLFVTQWLACRHFAGPRPNFVLPLGIENLPGLAAGLARGLAADDDQPAAANLDIVCSMGVLYHRRDHMEHLFQLKQLLRPGGKLVLETLVLPRDQASGLLIPIERYARMRNVWAIPGTQRLQEWIEAAGFGNIRLVDVTPTRPEEQRSTPWMTFESLAESLDPSNPDLTVEGYPAPVRAMVLAER